MDRADTCVILPTYNNAGTLAAVIESVAAYTRDILVVNDGSTDGTAAIIASFPYIKNISYPHNTGTGYALRRGFARAIELGYRYAITMDSDGQHFAGDLDQFVRQIPAHPRAIIIGARNMDQSSVPGKSSFGNRFSNFWFTLETGIRCPDTQSGYRLYPIYALAGTHFLTRKYEFEIEVLVRSAWKGIPVLSVPIRVYYPPSAERVTHFRPFKDFTRISLLNTVLVLITFFYIKPRDAFRSIIFASKTPQA